LGITKLGAKGSARRLTTGGMPVKSQRGERYERSSAISLRVLNSILHESQRDLKKPKGKKKKMGVGMPALGSESKRGLRWRPCCQQLIGGGISARKKKGGEKIEGVERKGAGPMTEKSDNLSGRGKKSSWS